LSTIPPSDATFVYHSSLGHQPIIHHPCAQFLLRTPSLLLPLFWTRPELPSRAGEPERTDLEPEHDMRAFIRAITHSPGRHRQPGHRRRSPLPASPIGTPPAPHNSTQGSSQGPSQSTVPRTTARSGATVLGPAVATRPHTNPNARPARPRRTPTRHHPGTTSTTPTGTTRCAVTAGMGGRSRHSALVVLALAPASAPLVGPTPRTSDSTRPRLVSTGRRPVLLPFAVFVRFCH